MNPSLTDIATMFREFQEMKTRLEYLESQITGNALPDRGSYDFAVRVLERMGRPLKKQTLYGKVCNKLIPHYHQGDAVMFNREDLELWDRWGRPACVKFEKMKMENGN